MQLFDVMALY